MHRGKDRQTKKEREREGYFKMNSLLLNYPSSGSPLKPKENSEKIFFWTDAHDLHLCTHSKKHSQKEFVKTIKLLLFTLKCLLILEFECRFWTINN